MNCRSLLGSSCGSSFSEVLVAMVIVPIALMGAMGAFHAAGRTIGQDTLASRALAMAESRIEAKRAARWDRLLVDDLNYDGLPDVTMRDDGQGGDLVAGDGVYSGSWEQDGVVLTWTVAPSDIGKVMQAGYVVIEARATYGAGQGQREIRMGTLRANPVFVGQR
jgi:hypothetical protein